MEPSNRVPSVTITAKLSHRLHETLGDEAAEDMVDWMQRVDVQHAELRELNELNFSRFAAHLQAAMARTDSRLGELDARLAKTDADLRREMETGFARLEMKIEQRTADIMKWSIVFWIGSVMTLVGTLTALVRIFPGMSVPK